MRRTIVLLLTAMLAFSATVLATDQSNNLLLANDCAFTSELLTPLWKVNLTGNIKFAPVNTVDGMVIVSTEKSVGVANSNSGQMLWMSIVDGGCKWNAVLSTNNSICAFRLDEMIGFSLRDGAKLWSKKLSDNITAQPVSEGEKIYVVTGKTVLAIESLNGKLSWDKTLKSVINVTPCLSNGNVILAAMDGYCVALNTRDGAIEWESKPGEQPTDSLVGYGKNIYVVCERSLFALDNATGKPIWKFVAKSNGFSPTVTEDALLYPTTDKTLYCLDPKTCGKGCCLATPKQLWQLNKSSMLPRRITTSSKFAYLTTEDGWVQVIDIVKGDLVSKHEVGLDLSSSVFLSTQALVPSGTSLRSFTNIPDKVEVFVDKPFINRDKFQINVGVGAKVVNGKSMLPAFVVLEPYGGNASWDSKTKTMTCLFEGKKLEAKLYSNIVTIDGKQVKLDTDSKVVTTIVNGRIMLPARFLIQSYMGFDFSWNQAQKSFIVERGRK
jgi:outer membrane protein assembly factor BamB